MSRKILVTYGTKHGSTREVAEAVAETLRERGFFVDTTPALTVVDVSQYAAVVVGGAIYAGRWHPDAAEFLEKYRWPLSAVPVAVFGMGPRTMEAHDEEESRAQLTRALDKVPEVVPCTVAVFGGVIEPRALRFPFSHLPASDARDWNAIRAWASEVACRFGKPAPETRDPRT